MKMHRYRFKIPGDDGRPITFPPPGPFWITGYGDEYVIVVAYCPDLETLTNDEFWPDAVGIDDGGEQEINFSGRFPKPEWWRHE